MNKNTFLETAVHEAALYMLKKEKLDPTPKEIMQRKLNTLVVLDNQQKKFQLTRKEVDQAIHDLQWNTFPDFTNDKYYDSTIKPNGTMANGVF